MGNSEFCGDSEKPSVSGLEPHSFGGTPPSHFILLVYYFAFSELISTDKESVAR